MYRLLRPREAAISSQATAIAVVAVVAFFAVGMAAYYMARPAPVSTVASSTPSSSTTTPSTITPSTTSSVQTTQSTVTSHSSSSTSHTSSSASYTTSTTSHLSSSTSSASSSTFTLTCTSTSTAAPTTTAALAIIKQFSFLSLRILSTNEGSGQVSNETFSFRVVSSTTAAYHVNATVSSAGSALSYLFQVQKNGTVDWAYTSIRGQGVNSTGGPASQAFEGLMAVFQLEAISTSTYSTAFLAQYFHVSGSGSVTIPTVTISYTTYVANFPYETIDYCGSSSTYTEFQVELGTIQGTNIQVLVSTVVKGTEGSTPVDYTIQLMGASL